MKLPQNNHTNQASIICMSKRGMNIRPGPGTTTGNPLMRMPYLAEAPILDVSKSKDQHDPFKWINIDYKNYYGETGWIREDFTRLKGNFEQFGLAFQDMYPNPAQGAWWSRDFNMNPDFNPILHSGWDQAGEIGTPILGGPNGGKVVTAAYCQKCGLNSINSIDDGYQFNDSHVFEDPDWNYGYGHLVIVTYHHNRLPKSTQHRLAEQNKEGWHISAMYSQLHTMTVERNQELLPNELIGTLDNSGNSTGAHIGLEVIAHKDLDLTVWGQEEDEVMSPAILFLR